MLFICVGLFIIYRTSGYEIYLWIQNHLMYVEIYYDSYGNMVRAFVPNWNNIIVLSLFIVLVMIALMILFTMISSIISSNRKIKKSIKESAVMIHTYMSEENKEITDVFPSKYAAISEQMLEIKSSIMKKEQILKDEAASKDNLIAYLAHDLKTPLTSVIGYLSLLDEVPDMPLEQREKYTKISLDKAHRLEKLINEFFEITRYNLQQITLEKEPTDISYMLVQMTDEFYPILKENNNTILLHTYKNESIIANVDSMKLARVFNNILKNAIAYSYPDTEIDIKLFKENNFVRILFQNKGNTIPEHKLESIFEKFYRLDEARTSNTGGAGLGLAIAKEIVALHNGTITATSKDNITVFTVTLPL